jgi:hypothetical protein
MRSLLVLAGLLAAMVTALAPPGWATTKALSTGYAISGIETSFPTGNTSTFAGGAIGSGGDLATWNASVVHQSLSNCPFGSGTSCTISGGTFALDGSAGQLAGTFSGGTVTPLTQQPGCGTQSFAVGGTLTTTNGPGTFTATLTHYRTLLFGRCLPYFATITGSLKLP